MEVSTHDTLKWVEKKCERPPHAPCNNHDHPVERLSSGLHMPRVFCYLRRYEQSHLLDTGILAQHVATTISRSQLTIVEPIAVLMHRFNSSRTEMLTDLSRSIHPLVSI